MLYFQLSSKSYIIVFWNGNNPFLLTNSQVFCKSYVDEVCCSWHIESSQKIDNIQIKWFWQNIYEMQVENGIGKRLFMSMLMIIFIKTTYTIPFPQLLWAVNLISVHHNLTSACLQPTTHNICEDEKQPKNLDLLISTIRNLYLRVTECRMILWSGKKI